MTGEKRLQHRRSTGLTGHNAGASIERILVAPAYRCRLGTSFLVRGNLHFGSNFGPYPVVSSKKEYSIYANLHIALQRRTANYAANREQRCWRGAIWHR